MDVTRWVKDNKKRIAREFVRRSGFESSTAPTGIITAGLPGAGKTEFTVELLKQTSGKTLRVDMDEIAQLIEGYRPEIADGFRRGASEILSKIYDEIIKNRFDFVLDGTFASPRAIENIVRALDHKYQVKVYYIHQEPDVAWKFTQAREKVEHRAIEKQGFIDTYIKLHDNLKYLCNNHKDVTISLILKDADNKVGRIIEDVPDFLQTMPPLLSRIELEERLQ